MGSSDNLPIYVYDIPYDERKSLCRILDMNDRWEELGGSQMRYDIYTLQRIGKAIIRNQSPTDELLKIWATHNHTIVELFMLLSKMQHYQAMMILKPIVPPKYHRLIYEGEENFSKIISLQKDAPSAKDSTTHNADATCKNPEEVKDFAFGEHNLNQGHGNLASGSKAVMEKSCDVKDEPKILNIPEKYKESSTTKKTTEQTNVLGEGLSPMISYKALEEATGCWDRRNLLGKGGFGTVYKGMWKNTQVAIKRLEIQKGGDLEETWKTQREQSLRELKYLNSCRHDNILPLYGYSIGGPHDCLVYQYMPNGSLEDRLLCKEQSKPLNWDQRYKIVTGTARGLQFLHTLGKKPLIHGDIKSANILLDPHWEPKIGDFGLAREGPLQQYTHVKVSRVHGTRPYLPDEFLRSKKLSTKVDTYSFGIVLFELATGLRAYDESRGNVKFLKDYIESLGDDRISEVRDIKAGIDDGFLFPSIIALGKCCTSSKAKDRPEMVHVLQKLDSMASTREMQLAQMVVRRDSLNPAPTYEAQFKYDHLSQQKRSLPQNQTVQGGIPQLQHQPNQSNPRSNSPFPTNAQTNSPFYVSPAPSSSVHGSPHQFVVSPQYRPKSPYVLQNAVPCSIPPVSPGIRVSPPSVPNFSDLLPKVLNQEVSDGCELPLISELGIKSNTESSQTSD